MLSLFLSRPKTGDPIVSTHVAHALRALKCLKEEADCHDGELDPLDLGGTQDTEPNESEGQRLSTTTPAMVPQASSQGTFTNPSSQVILDPGSTSTSFSLETSRHLRNFRDTNSRQSRNKIEQVILESRDHSMKFKNYLIDRDKEKDEREERERKRKRKEKNQQRKEAKRDRQWMRQ